MPSGDNTCPRSSGGCLCGAVRFEIEGELGPVVCCHCSQCRRASGSAFATNASVRRSALRFTAGEDRVKEFESSPDNFRAFCGDCGSPVYCRVASHPDIRRIRLGTLDDDPGARPVAHVHVASKAPWFDICDALERFDESGPPALVRPGRG